VVQRAFKMQRLAITDNRFKEKILKKNIIVTVHKYVLQTHKKTKKSVATTGNQQLLTTRLH
jgi:hypothetical protein